MGQRVGLGAPAANGLLDCIWPPNNPGNRPRKKFEGFCTVFCEFSSKFGSSRRKSVGCNLEFRAESFKTRFLTVRLVGHKFISTLLHLRGKTPTFSYFSLILSHTIQNNNTRHPFNSHNTHCFTHRDVTHSSSCFHL